MRLGDGHRVGEGNRGLSGWRGEGVEEPSTIIWGYMEAPTFPLQKALISSGVASSPVFSRMQAQISSPIRLSFTPTTCQSHGQISDIPSPIRVSCSWGLTWTGGLT